MPQTIEVIDKYAFRETALEKLVCPSNLKVLNDESFTSCNDLKEVTLNNKLETIGQWAFKNTGIHSIYIPASVKTIDNQAFGDCEKLKTVIIIGDTQISDNVAFSYIPENSENWIFIFVSEVIDDVITRTVGKLGDMHTTTYNIRGSTVAGDANGDGEVDMSDVVLIMQALTNPNKYGVNGTAPSHITENGFKYGDTDGNGLTVSDALHIQQYLLGLISSLTA